MSGSDSDDGFLQVFGKKRNQRTSNYNKIVTNTDGIASSSPTTAPESIALRPPERKIAAAQRQHQRAVNTVLKQNNMQRNVALSGMEAHRQTLMNQTSLVVTNEQPSNNVVPTFGSHATKTGGGSSSTSSSSDASAITYTIAKEASLQDAINRAMIIQEDKNNTFTDNDKIIAWTTVRSIANQTISNTQLSLQEKDKAFRAVLTALVREGDAHTRLEQLRAAIKAYESVYTYSKPIYENDPAKMNDLKSGLLYVLTKLSDLYSEIGSIDNLRSTFNRLAHLETKPSATAKDATSPPVSPSAKVTATKTVPKSPKEEKSITVAEKKQSSPPIVPAVQEEPKKVEVIESPVPEPVPSSPRSVIIPSIPELDGTPQTLFTRAALLAMFKDNFEDLNLLLNRALLSDPEALQAIKCVLPENKLNLLIICAAQGRPDLIRRLLGFYTLSEKYTVICQYKDGNGNNSIAHASLLQRHEALHELLCSLHTTHPKYTPYTPMDSKIEDVASLPDLGLRLEQAQAFSRPIQDQLRFFLHNPSDYVTAANETMNRTMNNTQPPLPPPLPNGPPPPISNSWNNYNRGPMSNMSAYHFREQINAAYAQFMQLYQQSMMLQNMNNMRIGNPSVRVSTASMATVAPVTPVSPGNKTEGTTNGEWKEPVGRQNNKNKNKNKGNNNNNASTPKESTLLDFLPSNVSKEAGEGKLAGRTLQAMELPPETNASTVVKTDELLEDPRGKGKGKGKKWDQFAANETLFGINAQYDETAYTTALDTKNYTKEQIANAEKLAAEILAAEDSSNPHIRAERGQKLEGEDELDEEALHSAVLGTTDSSSKTNQGKKDTFTDASIAKKVSKGKK